MGLATPKRLRGVKTVSHTQSPKQERKTAIRLGGETIKGSGSGDTKGDVRIKRVMRIELKNTTRASFSITRDMCRKIEDAALSSDELPAIEVEFLDAKGKVEYRVAVLPSISLEMLKAAKGKV